MSSSSEDHPPRTVLITGSSGGIGRATVATFAENGWQVIGVDRAPYGEDFPQNGLFIQKDVSVGENLEEIFNRVKRFTTVLNALINKSIPLIFKSSCIAVIPFLVPATLKSMSPKWSSTPMISVNKTSCLSFSFFPR